MNLTKDCSLNVLAKFDFELDCESLFPGKNTFEKFISGSYAGDLVRRVILDLTKKGVIFHGKISRQLSTYNFLTTVGEFTFVDPLSSIHIR